MEPNKEYQDVKHNWLFLFFLYCPQFACVWTSRFSFTGKQRFKIRMNDERKADAQNRVSSDSSHINVPCHGCQNKSIFHFAFESYRNIELPPSLYRRRGIVDYFDL